MGEIWLAYDPLCARLVALKRIRPEMRHIAILKTRFLREATLTAQLTHPGIVAIYSIHEEGDELYYTMPYIEGETLKQRLRRGQLESEHSGCPTLGNYSIPTLLPIFKSICQTVAYAHAQGILHRDLKPENILVGRFGEVIVLDWGLAQSLLTPHEDLTTEIPTDVDATQPGKIVGTVAYMAPERVQGASTTRQTDIYALGVILYHILTLTLPFVRSTVKEFKKNHKHERWLDPAEAAPYRDVPPRLAWIAKKCLHPDPAERYQTVDALITDLIGHMEGRSHWFPSAQLWMKRKKDWEFQENVYIAKHTAIAQIADASNWVSIMVSRHAFPESLRIETRLCAGSANAGVGFLLSVPEAAEREHPLGGYCVWLSTQEEVPSQLFRDTAEVLQFPQIHLQPHQWHTLSLEKGDKHLRAFLDGKLFFTYLSYLPLMGNHLGIVSKDADFQMDKIEVFVSSQNLQVSCLAIPDAFLAAKDFKRALAEYRRIGYSFPGHAEGREARFRAGMTLVEQARQARSAKKTEEYYALALEEFSSLHSTAGAPLEYLGKALVYQAQHDPSEEVKCLELGLRRYAHHPLVDVLQEQILYRVQEAAQSDRRSAYRLVLIGLRLIPKALKREDFTYLLKRLNDHWEPLQIFECDLEQIFGAEKEVGITPFATSIAFWLASVYTLLELFQEASRQKSPEIAILGDIIYAVFELGSYALAGALIDRMHVLKAALPYEHAVELQRQLLLFTPLLVCHSEGIQRGMELFVETNLEEMGTREFRILRYLLEYALQHEEHALILATYKRIASMALAREDRITLDAYQIWSYLKSHQWAAAEQVFDNYPLELINQETTLLHPLFACFLYATEGEEIARIHLAGVTDTPFPRSWALLGHEITNKILETPAWYNSSFLWERRQLYRQLHLYYHCADLPDLAGYYAHLEKTEYIAASVDLLECINP